MYFPITYAAGIVATPNKNLIIFRFLLLWNINYGILLYTHHNNIYLYGVTLRIYQNSHVNIVFVDYIKR